MGSEQKYIYYASGETKERSAALPQMEKIRSRGYDALLFTDAVDEFLPEMLHTFRDHEFRSILNADLGLESEEEKQALEQQQTADQELLKFIADSLDGKVKEAVLSANLGSHAVSIRPEGGMSFEMEKYFNRMNPGMGFAAPRVLELNAEHPAFAALKKAHAEDTEKAKKYVSLLYHQAILIAGLPLEDPTAFADEICSLMK